MGKGEFGDKGDGRGPFWQRARYCGLSSILGGGGTHYCVLAVAERCCRFSGAQSVQASLQHVFTEVISR